MWVRSSNKKDSLSYVMSPPPMNIWVIRFCSIQNVPTNSIASINTNLRKLPAKKKWIEKKQNLPKKIAVPIAKFGVIYYISAISPWILWTSYRISVVLVAIVIQTFTAVRANTCYKQCCFDCVMNKVAQSYVNSFRKISLNEVNFFPIWLRQPHFCFSDINYDITNYY